MSVVWGFLTNDLQLIFISVEGLFPLYFITFRYVSFISSGPAGISRDLIWDLIFPIMIHFSTQS